MSGDAAEPRAGQRRVRAALAVGEDRDAAAGEVLAFRAAAEGSLGLGLGELGVGLDVDLPAGEAGGQAGVQALLADRERELVVGDDDRRLLRLVVDETSRTRAGDSAFAMNRAGSVFHGMMSIFSPRSSETTMRTREPRGPTHAPTGSTPWACDSTAIFER